MIVRASYAVGAGHAREQKGAGIGAFLVPEHKVARMAALCPRVLLQSPIQNDLAGLTTFHRVESLLELINRQPVGDDGHQVQTTLD